MRLTFLDFFAGVGGFRKGMEMAGHECLGHCEIDKYAKMSYEKIHKPKENEWNGTDIRRVRAEELPKADVWCFGFPCQDISIAGNRAGFKGNRSSLFFAVTRLIRDKKEEDRPKYLFIENVKNLLSVNRGYDFARLLIELDEIGYDAEWQVINSKNFGVPQNRERVFIIGHFRGKGGSKVFPIRGNCSAIKNEDSIKLADYRYDAGLRIRENGESPCLTAGLHRMSNKNNLSNSIYVVGTTKPDSRKIGQRDLVYGTEGIMGCLTASDYKQPKQILIRENTKRGYVTAKEGDGIRLDYINSNTGRGRVQKENSVTLMTGNHAGVVDKGLKIRKLTPKECWRLQGWKDEDFEKAAEVCSDTQLYKQAGNGVTVNVIYEIAKKLI